MWPFVFPLLDRREKLAWNLEGKTRDGTWVLMWRDGLAKAFVTDRIIPDVFFGFFYE